MKYLFILLFFTLFLFEFRQSVLSFQKRHSIPFSSESEEQFHSALNTPTSSNQKLLSSNEGDDQEHNCGENCYCLTCNITLPAPKKVINPYKQELSNRVPQKPFGSFCVKCAACLAVASQLEKVIKSISEECETDPEKKKLMLQEISTNIEHLCRDGFKNFDLRSYNNHSVITNIFKCTTHIESNMDGNWTKKLRDLCALYTSRINIEDVSINILDSSGNLTNTLCRGTGIFRDCSNLKSHENITMPPCNTDCDG